MACPSLAGRLTVWLILVQSVLSVCALVGSMLFAGRAGDEYFFSHLHAENLVSDALAIQADGVLALMETRALREFRLRRPQARIAVIHDGRVLGGSAPDLVAAWRAMGSPAFIDASLVLQDGPLAGAVVVATEIEARQGKVVVMCSGNPMRLEDLPAAMAFLGCHLSRIMALVLLGAVICVPVVVCRALRPLRTIPQDAARIDLRSRDFRLPQGKGVPAELAPLVWSINTALDRLDAGIRQQQRFVAVAAHEMRTPLAILAARIDSLGKVDEADGMRRDIGRMRSLVDQLLFVARLERRDVLFDETIDLVALARTVVANGAPLAVAQGRDLALVPGAASLPVVGSAHALESALTNLVQNALRFEPIGGTVEVVVAGPADIRVIDHGPGISPNDREHVFEPFWRREDGQNGAGLGLTIVREVTAIHGGAVSIEDTPGGGATVHIRLQPASAAQPCCNLPRAGLIPCIGTSGDRATHLSFWCLR